MKVFLDTSVVRHDRNHAVSLRPRSYPHPRSLVCSMVFLPLFLGLLFIHACACALEAESRGSDPS